MPLTTKLQTTGIGLLAAIGLSLSCATAESQERVFRSSDGREIVAKMVSATASTVTIAMEGGKEFSLPIEKLSAADQAFIKEWLKENPPAFDYRMTMTDARKRLERSESKQGHEVTTTETWVVNLKLENRSGVDLEGLVVRYRIFISDPVRGDTRERATSTTDGALAPGIVANNQSIEFATKQFDIELKELVDGYYWGDGSKGAMEQKIEGIYVKVFHRDKNVFDYRSGNSEVKNASWSDEKALELKVE